MDDVLSRLIVVLAGTGVVIVVAAVLSARRRRPSKAVASSGLAPGIYLFSSRDCGECTSARGRLDRAVGGDGYTEITFEAGSAVFDRLGITEVPSTLVVAEDGSAMWHRDVPSWITKPGDP